MKLRNFLLLILVTLSIAGWGPFSFFSGSGTSYETMGSDGWLNDEAKVIGAQADNLDPVVLKLGLTAYLKARQKGLDDRELLTLVDYTKPSSERRLWVVDVKNKKVLFNTWVAHGKNSGGAVATSFSNDVHSLKSSLGVFLTDETYSGRDGYSLRMQGLEQGINDNALRRDIVFHGAAYVSQDVAASRGMVGRSWGCLAVSEDVVHSLINTIKNKTLVVAYYPDQAWLKNSKYVNTQLA